MSDYIKDNYPLSSMHDMTIENKVCTVRNDESIKDLRRAMKLMAKDIASNRSLIIRLQKKITKLEAKK